MGQVVKIESNIEFFAFLNSNNVTNVILGNGFSLSHPVLKDSFKFDFETVKDYIESSLKDVPKGIQNCPEKVLGYIRKSTVRNIISSYIEKFCSGNGSDNLYDKYIKTPYSCEIFLTQFHRIYTLNYDPITYFEFLKNHDKWKESYQHYMKNPEQWVGPPFDCSFQHIDGFVAQKGFEIDQQEIVKHLKYKKFVLMYLHGSYFIHIDYETNRLKKLTRNLITSSFLKNSIENSSLKPFLLLEESWQYKKNLIQKYEYLKYCYENLASQKMDSILIFGASFSNDDHILEALRENTSLNNIYVTCHGHEELMTLKNKISEVCGDDSRFYFLILNTNENYIWFNDAGDQFDLVTNGVFEGFSEWEDNLSNIAPHKGGYEQVLYEEWPDHISECIDSIERSENFEELERNETQNCLYYHCIESQILNTDKIDEILNNNNIGDTEKFNQIKIYILKAMSDLNDYLSNRGDHFRN